LRSGLWSTPRLRSGLWLVARGLRTEVTQTGCDSQAALDCVRVPSWPEAGWLACLWRLAV